VGEASKEHRNGRKLIGVTSTETAILIWLAVGAGIAGGVFIVARSAVQIGSVAYRVMEKQLSGAAATRQTMLLTGAMVAAIVVTAFIAGYAIFAVFGSVLDSSGLLSNTTNGT
jgi:hypothetical protein